MYSILDWPVSVYYTFQYYCHIWVILFGSLGWVTDGNCDEFERATL